jgi:hypothetical protein
LLSEKDRYGNFNPENDELAPVKITFAEKRLTELFNNFLKKTIEGESSKLTPKG